MPHTPGPWKANEGSVNAAVNGAWGDVEEVSDAGFSVATVWADVDELEDCAGANAHLIAAAPDLLNALRAFLDRYTALVNCGDCGNWDPETEDFVIQARAALAKAEGQ